MPSKAKGSIKLALMVNAQCPEFENKLLMIKIATGNNDERDERKRNTNFILSIYDVYTYIHTYIRTYTVVQNKRSHNTGALRGSYWLSSHVTETPYGATSSHVFPLLPPENRCVSASLSTVPSQQCDSWSFLSGAASNGSLWDTYESKPRTQECDQNFNKRYLKIPPLRKKKKDNGNLTNVSTVFCVPFHFSQYHKYLSGGCSVKSHRIYRLKAVDTLTQFLRYSENSGVRKFQKWFARNFKG